MDGASRHFSGGGYVMAFMSLEGIGIVDRQNLLVTVGDDDRLGAFGQALGHTGGVVGVGAFGAAHGIADGAIYGCSLVAGRRPSQP